MLMTLLKWILSEGRPYWYVFSMENGPVLRQTEITCESSPGNPSGHVLFQAAFLYVVITELMTQLHQKHMLTKKSSNILGWIIYLCLINMVALSRMYFACHFFHQCLLGAILGHFIARYMIRNTTTMDKVYSYGKSQMLAIGVIVAIAAVGIFFGQKLCGRDPFWSIKIAFNRCENPLFLRPDSTPVSAVVRDLGLFAGVILSAPLKSRYLYISQFDNTGHWLIKFCLAVITIIAYHAAVSMMPHNRGVLIYYCYSFLIQLCSVFVLLNYDSVWQYVSRRCESKLKSN
ncbi:hypothetical protein HA402_005862 [Bradysia odoriphaga]|nr:hypothetical protein HA402_005862 [Bradysia odoriphaga]